MDQYHNVDAAHESSGRFYEKSDPRDFSKLRIEDGVIHYRIYAQDGNFIPMAISDSRQIHCRRSLPLTPSASRTG
jgi:hypothetical protein